MFKHIFHAKHIFDPCREIKIKILYISKYNIKKNYSFYKIYINFPYLKETLKS